MAESDPDSRIHLAGEYVMDLLTEAEREAVEQALLDDPVLRHWVRYWEARLPKIYADLTPQAPPKRVWKQLRRRIRGDAPRYTGWQRSAGWRNLFAWQSLAMAMAVGVLSVSLPLQMGWLNTTPTEIATPSPSYVAVVRNDNQQPFWYISLYESNDRVLVTNLQTLEMPKDKVYELWLLPTVAGENPRSMGLLPTSSGTQQLPLHLQRFLSQAAGLAVSLEPLGGSPLPVPSGPVVFQADLEPIAL